MSAGEEVPSKGNSSPVLTACVFMKLEPTDPRLLDRNSVLQDTFLLVHPEWRVDSPKEVATNVLQGIFLDCHCLTF